MTLRFADNDLTLRLATLGILLTVYLRQLNILVQFCEHAYFNRACYKIHVKIHVTAKFVSITWYCGLYYTIYLSELHGTVVYIILYICQYYMVLWFILYYIFVSITWYCGLYYTIYLSVLHGNVVYIIV